MDFEEWVGNPHMLNKSTAPEDTGEYTHPWTTGAWAAWNHQQQRMDAMQSSIDDLLQANGDCVAANEGHKRRIEELEGVLREILNTTEPCSAGLASWVVDNTQGGGVKTEQEIRDMMDRLMTDAERLNGEHKSCLSQIAAWTYLKWVLGEREVDKCQQ